ncbi:MAG: hypothetical protein MPEBLZ_00661, partial [Candidatus Methanoperedens nitroreducens]
FVTSQKQKAEFVQGIDYSIREIAQKGVF